MSDATAIRQAADRPAREAIEVARAYYDAFNRRELDRATELVTGDLEWINHPLGAVYHGPEGFRRFLQSYAEAFPDSRVEIGSVVADGDRVVVEFTARGTQTGPLAVPGGEIPATRRSIEVPLCEVLEVRGGRIARGRSYWDSASMLRQLGVLETGGPA